MLRFYRTPALTVAEKQRLLRTISALLPVPEEDFATEWCFYIHAKEDLDATELKRLSWLLSETFEPHNFSAESFLEDYPTVLEIGPRLNFETPWSSNAVSICSACGIDKIARMEWSIRHGFPVKLAPQDEKAITNLIHDRMTQTLYPTPLQSLSTESEVAPVQTIPLIENGMAALRTINDGLGLGMDEQDLKTYFDLFVNELKRNPTDVELYQLGQANSEHSRHGFFKGQLIIDGQPAKETLMEVIKAPWRKNPRNSLIAFAGSSIRGDRILTLLPAHPGKPSPLRPTHPVYHPTLTAETHNFPSGVAPYPGAATGTGGRIRDNQAVGRGGLVCAGGAAYCTGNLHIPGYNLPWEQNDWEHPDNLASPLEIMIQASNGASDYGNCFGEPIIYGFTRTFGMQLPNEYRSWFKPVMYVVGAGQVDDRHVHKDNPEKGMLVVQLGGPAYRIGLGGGAASSMIQGANVANLDFDAVQRGNPQMEQRLNRVIRTCIELGGDNPFVAACDLGAGGDCNALPELAHPAGAKINLRSIPLGDKSLSVLEYWCNESQERCAFLVWPEQADKVKTCCERENVPYAVVGEISGDGRFTLYDDSDSSSPVDLPLDKILGKLPQKTFNLERLKPQLKPLKLPQNLNVNEALDRVLRLPSVGSKRFLTNKVDRSVTGLIAQQQCVGPNQLTLSDFAVIAQSHFSPRGVALSLGEQPIKGLISPQAAARMAVAEALLNMAGAKITALQDIKCSANWMWAAKLPGEGARLYDAAYALRDILIELGIAIDGGKDSLSMAAKTTAPNGSTQVAKAPGQLVIANYAPMEDITCKVGPDLKKPGNVLLFVDLANGKNRLGGSALAQTYQQVGAQCPDVEDIKLLKRGFEAVQELLAGGTICALHDRSDGGLITTLLEMAFAGNVGLAIDLKGKSGPIEALFSEELGLVIECKNPKQALSVLKDHKVPAQEIGRVGDCDGQIAITYNAKKVLDAKMAALRETWEATSSELDKLQANPKCVKQEATVDQRLTTPPPYKLTFTPRPTPKNILQAKDKPRVAILREQGSNGDREMASAFYLAGFDVWDITTTDLIAEQTNLANFRGIAFVGGFSFADVLDAGKGWAGVIRFNKRVAEQFAQFYARGDTFSLGVCNGCQLMALLGWVPRPGLQTRHQPRFIRNESGRFESRFSTVKISPSPAIMLKGMEGSTLGVWVAHGEGRLHFPKQEMSEEVIKEGLAPLRFVDEEGTPTETYPFNPNGSPEGITALCSPDGRHLALMPHPERTFLKWQWPWMPEDWKDLAASPWLRLFQNAYQWCRKSA